MQPCTKCGKLFIRPPKPKHGGRGRTRCDECRPGVHAIDGSKWRKIRKRVLAEEPYCAWPGCSKPSQHVDHVVPLIHGGDPYARSNLQGLCAWHNRSKGDQLPGDRRKPAQKPPGNGLTRRWVL